MKIRPLHDASTVIGQAVFLTGAMRTGTTMMAQLLGSLEHVEMFIEPPFSYILLPMIEELEQSQWKALFESILYEDYLIPALAGRNLNLNPNDLTYIRHMKDDAEVDDRLSRTHGHSQLVEQSHCLSVAFKMPEMMPYVPRVRPYFPDMTFLTMLRNPDDSIASMLKKRWYSDDGLTGKSNKWPLKSDSTLNFPFWLPDDEHDYWRSMNEVERCCYAYLFQYGSCDQDQFDHVIDYDIFVRNPGPVLERLIDSLSLRRGRKTASLLAGIREPKKERSLDWSKVKPDLKKSTFAMYEKWQNDLHLS